MLQELTLTPATIIVIALVIAWVTWAIRRLTKRGMCDCGDKCDGCSGCSAAKDMVARMESSLGER